MASYKVPAEKMPGGMVMPADSSKAEPKQPRACCLPIDPAWAQKLNPGDMVTYTITGEIVRVDASKSENNSRNEVDIAVDSVSYQPAKKGGTPEAEVADTFEDPGYEE